MRFFKKKLMSGSQQNSNCRLTSASIFSTILYCYKQAEKTGTNQTTTYHCPVSKCTKDFSELDLLQRHGRIAHKFLAENCSLIRSDSNDQECDGLTGDERVLSSECLNAEKSVKPSEKDVRNEKRSSNSK